MKRLNRKTGRKTRRKTGRKTGIKTGRKKIKKLSSKSIKLKIQKKLWQIDETFDSIRSKMFCYDWVYATPKDKQIVQIIQFAFEEIKSQPNDQSKLDVLSRLDIDLRRMKNQICFR